MQRYQTEDEHRKAMRAKINKTIKRGKRRKRIIRRLRKAVPGICIGVLIAGMGAWCIAAPLPDPDDYEPYRFQAENGQWYTQEEYEQMSRERDAYHQREREEAEKEAQMIRDYQEQYQKDQEAEWKLYQEQMRTGLIHSMDFDASDAYLLEKIAMAEAESEDTEGKALVITDTVEGTGVLGEIEDPVTGQFSSATIKIPFAVLYSDMFSIVNTTEPPLLTLRGSMQCTDPKTGATGYYPIRVVVRGKAKTTTLGKVAKGKKMESEVELEILYIKVEINNAVVLELDKLNFVFVLNGKDMLAQIRSQC